MCSTSILAYELGRKLVEDYDSRRQHEKTMNQRPTEEVSETKPEKEGSISRTVTQIDYGKHERTVKELQRQEQEEEFNRKRAEASMWCTLDHEHGPECKRPVMGCSHDHQKEWQIYEKSTDEKLSAADRFRQEGNEEYRRHNYGLAAVHYRKALLQFDYTFAEGEEEEKRLEQIKIPCLLNLAACKCQQEEWDEVLTQCRLALEINPNLVKAYYRTGLAYLARDEFDLAKDALTSAIEIEPRNTEVIAAMTQLKKKMANYKVKQKEVAKEMLAAKEAEEEQATDEKVCTDDVVCSGAGIGDSGGEHALKPCVEGEGNETADTGVETPAMAETASLPTLEVAPSSVKTDMDNEAPSGLRQRRAVGGDSDTSELRQQEGKLLDQEDDGDDDADLVALSDFQRKAMRMLPVAAVVLGVVSVLAMGVAWFGSTSP
eukprot:TRINITY_DN12633_c0_g1_i1.p1 TRINITY_DN12633_c0_g1~~TRINITY_DN12633_c0_g1_i1.p1  ORF type:complete len:431 (+),score=91.20 TRINITY_DN12633_c0_g1_i1:186-1478(+)